MADSVDVLASRLDGIAEDVREIKTLLRALNDWQRQTDSRLAAGNARFDALQQQIGGRDPLAYVWGTLAALAAGVASALWGRGS